MINARAETVAAKPAFRSAFRWRRCLIPADGFYERKKAGRIRQPYFIRLKDGMPLAFAVSGKSGGVPMDRPSDPAPSL